MQQPPHGTQEPGFPKATFLVARMKYHGEQLHEIPEDLSCFAASGGVGRHAGV